jgi:Domain of unknown function (DUF6894)
LQRGRRHNSGPKKDLCGRNLIRLTPTNAALFFHARTGQTPFGHEAEQMRSTHDAMNKINAYPDETGAVLSNVEEAIAYGRRVATELAEERRWEGYVIAITDMNGAEIACIPIAKSSGKPETS